MKVRCEEEGEWKKGAGVTGMEERVPFPNVFERMYSSIVKPRYSVTVIVIQTFTCVGVVIKHPSVQ